MGEYSFGPYCLIPNQFVLNCNSSSCRLTPRLLAVLQYLIENRERVVTKQELLDHIWQGSFIEECNVGRAVSTLRSVLSDNAENPTYIQTVSRVGYRFIHPVVVMHDPEPDSHSGILCIRRRSRRFQERAL
jgi:DNA-binding winged helix-turn-helix (wHTH) protein